MMRRMTFAPVAVLAAAMSFAGAAHAQGGFGGGGGGQGGGGGFMATLPPATRAKMQAWGKWRQSHPHIQELGRTMRTVGELDKDPATKITKVQAQQMLAVIKPWQGKPVMSDDQALAVNKALTKSLSLPQIKKMAMMAGQQGGRGGGGGFGGGGGRPGGGGGGFGGGGGGGFGGGGGRPGGGGPGGGPGGRPDFSKMADPKDYNPLNAATIPESPMKQRSVQRLTEFINMLKTRAA